ALSDLFDLSRPLSRLQAGRVAVCAVHLDASTTALAEARARRERERGRRPSLRDVERAARRWGRDGGSYQAALTKRGAVGPREPKPNPLSQSLRNRPSPVVTTPVVVAPTQEETS